MKGLAAMEVKNMAQVTPCTWYALSIRKLPMRPAVGPGSEP